jgi:hypothetical protein
MTFQKGQSGNPGGRNKDKVWTDEPSLRAVVENGLTLCAQSHRRTHGRKAA